MNYPKKVKCMIEQLENFQANCNDSMKQFIDVIKPMLYNDNHCELKISFGQFIDGGFISSLNSFCKRFTVILSETNTDIFIIFRNENNNSIVAFNLNFIKENNDSKSMYVVGCKDLHNIVFRYSKYTNQSYCIEIKRS